MEPATAPMIGTLVPQFDLPATVTTQSPDGRVSSNGFLGRWLVLLFYPRDFSLVCPTELVGFDRMSRDFENQGASILAISCDSVESHERWLELPREQGGIGPLNYPLGSDLNGSVSRAFGVYNEHQRVALRGLFIIDPNGVLQYMVVHNLSVGRRTEEILRVLSALQTGGLCCEGWTPGKSVIDPTKVLRPGRVLSHYRIEAELGAGSFAHVYQAHDLVLERMVALKLLKNGNAPKGRTVLTEARAAARLNHPNVCTIYAVDDAEGASFIAMEYINGIPLGSYAKDEELTLEARVELARQIAAGMADAHAHNVVHGDLKPSNLLVTEDGRLKILDFGLSRVEVDQSNRLGDTLDLDDPDTGITGTPNYMAPEQADGQVPVAASDVFSLGLILFELITGRSPVSGRNILQVLNSIRRIDPDEYASQVPAPYDQLIARMLVRDPAARTIRMSEIADELAESIRPSNVLMTSVP